MNYKRQEIKYNHYLYENKFLIGVSKDIYADEASLVINNPMLIYERQVYSKILQLDHNDRKAVMSALERWEKLKTKESSFGGLYWDMVLDFVLAIYGMTTMDLSHEMIKMDCFQNYDEKTLFDNIEQMRKNKGSIRWQGEELVTRICYCCRISKDVVKNGQGILNCYEEGDEYTTEKLFNIL